MLTSYWDEKGIVLTGKLLIQNLFKFRKHPRNYNCDTKSYWKESVFVVIYSHPKGPNKRSDLIQHLFRISVKDYI
ncbi:hypothetical protein CEE45_05430 [Candidatus Heimdallarchaeota archaeon B3_Heim]|nr:MAG: hypothetical protein CEE45_05430 [Candidatus Heimdallarchaeota archaeon B3_Heim]